MFQAFRCYDNIPEPINLKEEMSVLAPSLRALSPWSAGSIILRSVARQEDTSPHHTQEGKRDRYEGISVPPLLKISTSSSWFSKRYLVSLRSKFLMLPAVPSPKVPSDHLTLSCIRLFLFQLLPERTRPLLLGQGHGIMRWLLDHILWSPTGYSVVLTT